MNSFETWGSTLLPSIELLATLAFALSGIMAAARKRMDVVGVCVVGFLAAFGGGTLRDILLDQRPFFWVENEIVLWAVLALSIFSITFMRQRHFQLTEKTLQWPDTLGLGLFTASGVAQSLALDMPPTVAVLMGMITGIFGGVLRDIVCNEIPVSFKDHRPYALCSVAGGVTYIMLDALESEAWFCMSVCALVTIVFRVLAIWNNWVLPAWRKD
jgi:uncharacterized membrane protein YeiH